MLGQGHVAHQQNFERKPRIMDYMKQIEESACAVRLSAGRRYLIENSYREFCIANPEKGGKYVVFSNELALALDITESVDILPVSEEGLIIAAKRLPFTGACAVTLTNAGGNKFAYNSALVDLLVETMQPDFFGRDRRLFHDIDVDRLTDGTIAAFIRVYYVDEFPPD